MDPRLLELLTAQQQTGFRGLAGSEAQATIRVSEQLLNDAVARFLPPHGALKNVTIHPQAENRFAVRLTLAKPSFLPPLTVSLAIERQPSFPADPVLVLELTGGGGVLRLAAPAITSLGLLPPGVRMEGGRFFVDIRKMLEDRGQADALHYVEDLRITTEAGSVVIATVARVRA